MHRIRKFILHFILLNYSVILLGAASSSSFQSDFPIKLSTYSIIESDQANKIGLVVSDLTLMDRLKIRAKKDSMNVIATILFFGAILHTFFSGRLLKLSHQFQKDFDDRMLKSNKDNFFDKKRVSFKARTFHFLGEVEAIFGIWVLPLIICMTFSKGWKTTTAYIDNLNFTEPLFVVVIMAIAASKPIIVFSRKLLSFFAKFGKSSISAWWLSILIVAPLLGSFITEPAAMTIAALLLSQQFYIHKPSNIFMYATLGLLFVNISVGGTLTHFAAPPVLMVASKWEWSFSYMLTNFGWRAFLGILIATVIYYFIFRSEFKKMNSNQELIYNKDEKSIDTPLWIIFSHIAFLGWTVFNLHHPALFIGGFLVFIAFTYATEHYQENINFKSPILVGFFLAGLVTHGGLQGWWIEPVLTILSEQVLFFGSLILTAFNDNAAITYLASQVPSFNHNIALDVEYAKSLQYAVVAGAVAGGGLTVIANAPNPAGQNILNKFFKGGISPIHLFLSALVPTLIMILVFIVIP